MGLPKSMSGKIAAVVIVLLVASATVAVYFKERPDDSHVRASGTVEVTQVQLAPLAGGRILELAIDESDHVEKGQFIARLSMDGADDDVKMAEASLNAARAKLDELNNGYRKEDIARARAQVGAYRAQYEQAKRDEERFTALAADGVVAEREAELAVENSKSALDTMRAAEEQLRLLENGPRKEEIAAAEANLANAEAAYKKAQTLVGYKELYSPVSGVVLTKNYEIGDVINAGAAVATLGDLTDCWVKLYIPSTQLSLVKLGGKCSVFVDPYPDRAFEATITEINQQAEYNPRMSLTQSERANMVFWIKVSIKDTGGVIKPGMPADVTIL